MQYFSLRAFILIGLTLSGCDKIRNTFGFDHYQADEMSVDPNPATRLPPNLQLLPPRPGAPNPYKEDATTKAENVLGRRETIRVKKRSKGSSETAFLNKAERHVGPLPQKEDESNED